MINRISEKFDPLNAHVQQLYEAILALRTTDECEHFLRDLCTEQELKGLADRFEIAELICSGAPYRVITAKTGASSTTISRVAHSIIYGKGGLQLAYEKLQGIKQLERMSPAENQ